MTISARALVLALLVGLPAPALPGASVATEPTTVQRTAAAVLGARLAAARGKMV